MKKILISIIFFLISSSIIFANEVVPNSCNATGGCSASTLYAQDGNRVYSPAGSGIYAYFPPGATQVCASGVSASSPRSYVSFNDGSFDFYYGASSCFSIPAGKTLNHFKIIDPSYPYSVDRMWAVIPNNAPAIGTASALSTASIRWNFTDNSSKDTYQNNYYFQFELFSENGVYKGGNKLR
jgi:hypothetical protein